MEYGGVEETDDGLYAICRVTHFTDFGILVSSNEQQQDETGGEDGSDDDEMVSYLIGVCFPSLKSGILI